MVGSLLAYRACRTKLDEVSELQGLELSAKWAEEDKFWCGKNGVCEEQALPERAGWGLDGLGVNPAQEEVRAFAKRLMPCLQVGSFPARALS